MDKLLEAERHALRADIPPFAPGDTVKVHVKVREGEKERIQVFNGLVIARSGGGVRETFTVPQGFPGDRRGADVPVHRPFWTRSKWSAMASFAVPSSTT